MTSALETRVPIASTLPYTLPSFSSSSPSSPSSFSLQEGCAHQPPHSRELIPEPLGQGRGGGRGVQMRGDVGRQGGPGTGCAPQPGVWGRCVVAHESRDPAWHAFLHHDMTAWVCGLHISTVPLSLLFRPTSQATPRFSELSPPLLPPVPR